jgi:hypothetical protein
MRPIRWSIKEIVEILQARQKNEFDGNVAVSGDRGNGKSTCVGKIFYRFPKFNPWVHQVYSRDEAVNLLKTQYYGLCWDDEAINSGYKRDFQNKGQQEMIKILTAYRDNFNIFASAIPNFFSLDKDLRDLYFLHLHVIERGIAVVHMPLQGRLYSQDRWDAKYNAKIESTWSKKMMKNVEFKPPYHRLSTFKGYLFFNDMTENQKILYKEVKKKKREDGFLTELEKQQGVTMPWIDKVYKQLIEKKLTKDGMIQICLMENKKYSSVNSQLNVMLTDNGFKESVKDFLQDSDKTNFHNNVDDEIKKLIPSF